MSDNKMVEETENNNTNTETENNPDLVVEPKRRGRPPKVEKERFVEMWNSSANLDEVSQALGISKMSASVRASNLRKAGTELTQFRRGRKTKPKADAT
jgi:hypothetical protein